MPHALMGLDYIKAHPEKRAVNHLMLHKVGLNTYYGQAFLPDIAKFVGTPASYGDAYIDSIAEETAGI